MPTWSRLHRDRGTGLRQSDGQAIEEQSGRSREWEVEDGNEARLVDVTVVFCLQFVTASAFLAKQETHQLVGQAKWCAIQLEHYCISMSLIVILLRRTAVTELYRTI